MNCPLPIALRESLPSQGAHVRLARACQRERKSPRTSLGARRMKARHREKEGHPGCTRWQQGSKPHYAAQVVGPRARAQSRHTCSRLQVSEQTLPSGPLPFLDLCRTGLRADGMRDRWYAREQIRLATWHDHGGILRDRVLVSNAHKSDQRSAAGSRR